MSMKEWYKYLQQHYLQQQNYAASLQLQNTIANNTGGSTVPTGTVTIPTNTTGSTLGHQWNNYGTYGTYVTGTGSIPQNVRSMTMEEKLAGILDKEPTDLASYVLQAKAHLIKAIKTLDREVVEFEGSPATAGSFIKLAVAMKKLRDELHEAVLKGHDKEK